MATSEAKRMAMEKELDLVKISPKATPPVCKIMDYGKYCFESSKQEKEAKKHHKTVEIKEVRLSVNIDVHDFNTKANHANKFLQRGHRVKASVKFRGREMMHTNLGADLLNRFLDACSEFGSIERPPKMEGRNMICFITPKNK